MIEIRRQRGRCEVSRPPLRTKTRGNADKAANDRGVLGEIDLLAKENPRVDVMHAQSRPCETLDQVAFNSRQVIFAAKVRGNTTRDSVELPGR